MNARVVLLLCAAGAWAGEGEAPNLAVETPPAARVGLDDALRTGVEFLVANQNGNGSFGQRTSGRTFEVTSHVPGGHQAFQAATTALCWMGMQDAADAGVVVEGADEARRRALEWLCDHARVKRAHAGQLYNVWSFSYGLRALARALEAGGAGVEPERLRATARAILSAAEIYQTPDGGWGYYDWRARAYKPSWSTSFSTATMLVAFHEARQAGLAVDEDMVARALKNVRMARTPDGSYIYGLYLRYGPNYGINRPGGSSLRDAACTLGRRLFDDGVGLGEVRDVLERLVEQHRFAIAGVRRPIPHESWYAVSGYFYLYGHMYAADLLAMLPADEHEPFRDAIVRFVLKTRQPDGSFWDYPLYGYHKYYGTGYALMALADCARMRGE